MSETSGRVNGLHMSSCCCTHRVHDKAANSEDWPEPGAIWLHSATILFSKAVADFPRMKTVLHALQTADAVDFMFLPCALLILYKLCLQQQTLHGRAVSPNSFIITGPHVGTKAEALHRCISHPTILSAMQEDFPPRGAVKSSPNTPATATTIMEVLDLANWPKLKASTLMEFILTRLISRLKDDEDRVNTRDILQCTLELMKSARMCEELCHISDIVLALCKKGLIANDELSRFVQGSYCGPLALINAVLRRSRMAFVFSITRVERLFNETDFDRSAANMWKDQLIAIATKRDAAIGCILCPTLRRAEQLFESDPTLHEFPPEYTHTRLFANGAERFGIAYMNLPTWTRERLCHFIWATVKRGLGSVSPDRLAAEAARLDDLFIPGGRRDSEAAFRALDESLEMFLCFSGTSPVDVAKTVKAALLPAFKGPCSLEAILRSLSPQLARPEIGDKVEQALQAVAAYMQALAFGRRQLRSTACLGFRHEVNLVHMNEVRAVLLRPNGERPSELPYEPLLFSRDAEPMFDHFIVCLDAAIDCGLLQFDTRSNEVTFIGPTTSLSRIGTRRVGPGIHGLRYTVRANCYNLRVQKSWKQPGSGKPSRGTKRCRSEELPRCRCSSCCKQ